MKRAPFCFVWIGLALNLGCHAQSRPAPPAGGDVLFRSHFLGTAQLAANTNGAKLREIWALPETAALRGDVLEKLSAEGGHADLYRVSGDLVLELDDLLPLVEAGEMLGFITVQEGDLHLTPLGQAYAEASILARISGATFTRNTVPGGELLIVDNLETDGSWDPGKSMITSGQLAAVDRFSMLPGAPSHARADAARFHPSCRSWRGHWR